MQPQKTFRPVQIASYLACSMRYAIRRKKLSNRFAPLLIPYFLEPPPHQRHVFFYHFILRQNHHAPGAPLYQTVLPASTSIPLRPLRSRPGPSTAVRFLIPDILPRPTSHIPQNMRHFSSSPSKHKGDPHVRDPRSRNSGSRFHSSRHSRSKSFSQRTARTPRHPGLLSCGLEPCLRRSNGSLQRNPPRITESQCGTPRHFRRW